MAPLCKAADPADITEYLAKVKVDPDTWADVAQCIGYYGKIYTARALGSRQLNLNGYEIETIPTNLPEQLRHLWLKKNKIETIANLNNLHNLEVLNLSNNLIATGLENLNLPELREFHLKKNQLETIPHPNCPNLDLLSLKSNKIKTITENINLLTNLDFLVLTDNLIATIDNLNLLYMIWLALDDNQIETTTNFNAPELWTLSLKNNSIAAIPNHLPNLRELFLDNNGIRTITDDHGLPHLRELSLRNNSIETIDPQDLDQFPNLQWLYLEGNFLEQDNINQLKAYVAAHPNLHIDFGTQREGGSVKGAKR